MGALILGAPPVDRGDPDQRPVALTTARLPGRAVTLIAGAELAALDLRGRDVDVPLGRSAGQPQEAVTLWHPVEDAGDPSVSETAGSGSSGSSFRLESPSSS